MRKTICDICGKEMSTIKHVDSIENMNFCMSSHGRIWDICTECRVDLNRWMTIRRKESEDKDENKGVSDTLTVTFDSSLYDMAGICISRVVNEKNVILKAEVGEQADILYHLLTEQTAKAEIKEVKNETDN